MIIPALKDADAMVVAGSMMIGWAIYFYYCWRIDRVIDARANVVTVYIVITEYDGNYTVECPGLTSMDHTDTDVDTAPSSSLPSQQQQEIPMVPAQLISNETPLSNELPHAEFIRFDNMS